MGESCENDTVLRAQENPENFLTRLPFEETCAIAIVIIYFIRSLIFSLIPIDTTCNSITNNYIVAYGTKH
jgi:hypothetical protein